MSKQNTHDADEELLEGVWSLQYEIPWNAHERSLVLEFKDQYPSFWGIYDYIKARDQSIKEQAEQIVRLDEIRRTMDAWHGKDDEEFADIMNDRIATLHSTNNTKEADS